MDKWPHRVGSYTPDEVQRYCVQDGAWQIFRMSLKGLSTPAKLARLDARRTQHIAEYGVMQRYAAVQIDNYINALRRGGQLDLDNKVQR